MAVRESIGSRVNSYRTAAASLQWFKNCPLANGRFWPRKADVRKKAVSAKYQQATSFDQVARSYEKPDRYAAAICIKVRSDCSLRGYSATKAVADPCYEGRNGPQTLSEC